MTRYRIMRSSEDYYFIQRRRWWWPFWSNFYVVNEGGGPHLVTFDSSAKAEDLIRRWEKKETFRVIKELP